MKYIVRDYKERYYLGLEHVPTIKAGTTHQIQELWQRFLGEVYPTLNKAELHNNFIGLECYPPDFYETKEFDYFTLVESKFLIKMDGFVSKKLPKGKYVSFEIEFDDLYNEIQNVYQYIKEHKMNVHFGFDYEDYIKDQNYSEKGAKLYFTLMLNND